MNWDAFDPWSTGSVDELRAYIGHLHRARDELRAELAIAQSAVRVLAHCYDHDVRPPLNSLQYGRKLPVRLPYCEALDKETP